MQKKDPSLDDLFNSLELEQASVLSADERAAITLWLPERYKDRYAKLQEKTKRMFGKKLQEMVMRSIDKLDRAS